MPGWRKKSKKKQGWAVFPGQGSQRLGMFRALKEETRERMFKVLRKVLERDPWFVERLIQLVMLDPKGEGLPKDQRDILQAELNRTNYAQMAIFYLCCGLWDEGIETAERIPSDVFGLSLGEYGALYAARVINLEVGTILVYMRGGLMFSASVSLNGGMIGVERKEEIRGKDIKRAVKKTDVIISNDHSSKQITLSGGRNYLDEVSTFLQREGYKVRPVPVSGAFHNPKYMASVEDGLKRVITELNIKFRNPRLRVHFNYDGNFEDKPKLMPNKLIQGVVSPTQLRKIIDGMKKKTTREKIWVINDDPTINKILDDYPELMKKDGA